MSSHKVSNLKQFLQHNDYVGVFDVFFEILVFLNELRISTLHKMFAIRCDEIIASRSSDQIIVHVS